MDKPERTNALIDRRCGEIRFSFLARVLFALSCAALTALLSVKGRVLFLACGVLLSFVLMCLLAFRFRLLERLFSPVSRRSLVIAAVLACYGAYRYGAIFLDCFSRLGEELGGKAEALLTPSVMLFATVFIALAALPMLFAFLHGFVARLCAFLVSFVRTSDQAERLWFAIGGLLLTALILVSYALTTVFYAPNSALNDIWHNDIVYTTDTSVLMSRNIYLIVSAAENDIRQPLFGLFAAPFALLSGLLSEPLFFAPRAYFCWIAILQAALMLLSAAMLKRMLKLQGSGKGLFLACYGVTYPFLLFALNLEQYVFALFWLILLVYQYCASDSENRALVWVAATGSLLTSGITIFLVSDRRPLVKRCCDMLRACLIFLACMVIFARFTLISSFVSDLLYLLRFTGEKLSFSERFIQFSRFPVICLIAPAAEIISTGGDMCFRAATVSSVDPIGILLLLAAIAGFALNRKEKIAQVSFCWILFSFLLLCAVGWGTAENGLILYSLYFSWAYLALFALLLRRVTAKCATIGNIVLACAAVALLLINLPSVYALIGFGVRFYPAA